LWRPPERASVLSYITSVQYVPAKVELVLPLFPAINRPLLGALVLFVGVAVFGRGLVRGIKLDRVCKLLIGIMMVGNVLRVMANRQSLHYGPTVVPGLVPRNVITFCIEDVLLYVTPFVVGLALGSTRQRRQGMLRSWVACGVVYAVLSIIELRLSPQVNRWVYGYLQHSWAQMVREGGYRPLLFMTHGLELALFSTGTVLLSTILARYRRAVFGVPTTIWSYFVLVIVLLSNSTAAALYAVTGKVLLHLASPRRQLSVALLVGLLVLANPITRTAGWLPTERLVDAVASWSPARAQSLGFRFENEDLMIERVRKKLWTGWGGYARIRSYDEITGEDLTTVDGAWIIVFASGGIPRFVGVFGLLFWPVFAAWRRRRQLPRSHLEIVAAFSIPAAFFAVDLIPNGQFNQLPFLLSGMVLGCVRANPDA
jgi:hypothetical protein